MWKLQKGNFKNEIFFRLINTLFGFHQDNNNQIDLNFKLMSSPYDIKQTLSNTSCIRIPKAGLSLIGSFRKCVRYQNIN